jgi:hypothetical protein
MKEAEAADLVRTIVKLLNEKGQWYSIRYEWRGDKLQKILITEISIKIK